MSLIKIANFKILYEQRPHIKIQLTEEDLDQNDWRRCVLHFFYERRGREFFLKRRVFFMNDGNN